MIPDFISTIMTTFLELSNPEFSFEQNKGQSRKFKVIFVKNMKICQNSTTNMDFGGVQMVFIWQHLKSDITVQYNVCTTKTRMTDVTHDLKTHVRLMKIPELTIFDVLSSNLKFIDKTYGS